MNIDFNNMTLEELRQYILNNREDNRAFSLYISRLRSSDTPRQTININTPEGEADFKRYLNSKS
jgi:hypothetical protein